MLDDDEPLECEPVPTLEFGKTHEVKVGARNARRLFMFITELYEGPTTYAVTVAVCHGNDRACRLRVFRILWIENDAVFIDDCPAALEGLLLARAYLHLPEFLAEDGVL